MLQLNFNEMKVYLMKYIILQGREERGAVANNSACVKADGDAPLVSPPTGQGSYPQTFTRLSRRWNKQFHSF